MNTDITSTGASVVPDRRLIRAAHGVEGVNALIKAYRATVWAQDGAVRACAQAYRLGAAKADPAEVEKSDKANAAAYAAEQALHALWRRMGYQDCPTYLIGGAIEWSF